MKFEVGDIVQIIDGRNANEDETGPGNSINRLYTENLNNFFIIKKDMGKYYHVFETDSAIRTVFPFRIKLITKATKLFKIAIL